MFKGWQNRDLLDLIEPSLVLFILPLSFIFGIVVRGYSQRRNIVGFLREIHWWVIGHVVEMRGLNHIICLVRDCGMQISFVFLFHYI